VNDLLGWPQSIRLTVATAKIAEWARCGGGPGGGGSGGGPGGGGGGGGGSGGGARTCGPRLAPWAEALGGGGGGGGCSLREVAAAAATLRRSYAL
jgi:hypothetical protein